MDGVDTRYVSVSSRRVPLHVSDPLDYNGFDLHVCSDSDVPPSHIHIQIRSNDTSIVPQNECQFPIFLGELELIQTQMTQKPMLRAEVYARALRASQNRKEDSV